MLGLDFIFALVSNCNTSFYRLKPRDILFSLQEILKNFSKATCTIIFIEAMKNKTLDMKQIRYIESDGLLNSTEGFAGLHWKLHCF